MSVYPPGVHVARGATISPDGRYRYSLSRSWADDDAFSSLAFIMLNPSTADAEKDDPTIRRCVGLARSLGYAGIFVMNLFAYRTAKPVELWRAMDDGVDVVGPDPDNFLEVILEAHSVFRRPVVAAWGAAPRARPRVEEVLRMRGAENLHAFAVTNSGAPRHPLYLPAESELSPWAGPTVSA